MRNKNLLPIIILVFGLSVPILASDASQKSRLASEFFDISVTAITEPIVDRMLMAATRQGVPDAHLKIFREEILKVFRSEDYRGAYIRAYMDTFSLEELKSLVDLSKHPAFGIYLAKSQRITELTYPTFVRLQKVSEAEVDRRIRALSSK